MVDKKLFPVSKEQAEFEKIILDTVTIECQCDLCLKEKQVYLIPYKGDELDGMNHAICKDCVIKYGYKGLYKLRKDENVRKQKKIVRFKRFQQVIVLKCRKCGRWQGQTTTRTQEQLNDYHEQRRLKLKQSQCNYCGRQGQLIDLFMIKGICSNREAINVIQEKNNEFNKPVEELPGFE